MTVDTTLLFGCPQTLSTNTGKLPMYRLYAFSILLAVHLGPPVASADEQSFPMTFEWGTIKNTSAAVELHVESVPDQRVIRIPRFNNPYKRIYLKSDTAKDQLKFKPEVKDWLITLPDSAGAPTIIVIETAGTPELLTEPFVTKPNTNGEFILPAHHAVVHGKLLRYEPQPHKNTVGYWANEMDWCEWQIEAVQPGSYEVQILQGCGKGHGGSDVQIKLGDSELTFVVEDTGHFQNFRKRMIGTLQISTPGRQPLKVVPVSKAKGAVMDVREIRLIPVRS